MRKLKTFVAVVMLVFVLGLAAPQAFAGDIATPGYTEPQEAPGDIGSPGFADWAKIFFQMFVNI
jgi:hypothetical protein